MAYSKYPQCILKALVKPQKNMIISFTVSIGAHEVFVTRHC